LARRGDTVRGFILEHLGDHAGDIVTFAANSLGMTRNGILYHLNKLIAQGLVESEGTTKARRYRHRILFRNSFELALGESLEEDLVWREELAPHLRDLPKNVYELLQYGFTEILNNAIDHSDGTTCRIWLLRTAVAVQIHVVDDGVGIFRKIRDEKGLRDERHAILELKKGKLTTDASRHSGEGIFFTSRAMDEFFIFSRGMFFIHDESEEDWLIEHPEVGYGGTSVALVIHAGTTRSLNAVFDEYTSVLDDGPAFSKTHVPLRLAQFDGDMLVSRSQAKRVLARCAEFREVLLDFKEVETIGQAFADQIFRVYRAENPETEILWVNANPVVEKMIRRAMGGAEPSAPLELSD